jgi:hypothetical protein
VSHKEKVIWFIAGTGLTAFIVLQFLPVWWFEPSASLINPPVLTDIRWNAPETANMVERACYMCHSNQTRLPIYMQVAPLSWLAAQRVNNGRAHLNFSEQRASQIRVEELVEVIEAGTMPPPQYLLLHPEAQFSPNEKAQLIAGIRATFAALARSPSSSGG